MYFCCLHLMLCNKRAFVMVEVVMAVCRRCDGVKPFYWKQMWRMESMKIHGWKKEWNNSDGKYFYFLTKTLIGLAYRNHSCDHLVFKRSLDFKWFFSDNENKYDWYRINNDFAMQKCSVIFNHSFLTTKKYGWYRINNDFAMKKFRTK